MKKDSHLIHVLELEERGEYVPLLSDFLTPSEQAAVSGQVKDRRRLFFWGGYPGAERRAALFLPEWALDSAPPFSRWDSGEREDFARSLIQGSDPAVELSSGISLLTVKGSGHRDIRHRDILGSLMGLGIVRQRVGDICALSSSLFVVALSDALSDFVTDSLERVGSDTVHVTPTASPELFRFDRQYEETRLTVASMRLDCIVSAVTGMSRTRTAEAVSDGAVQLSGELCDSVSRTVCIGDTLSVRGYGKYIISEEEGLSRKARIRLIVKKYL